MSGVAASLAFGFAFASRAEAAEVSVPGGCGSAEEFRREVARRVGAQVEVPEATVRIERRAVTYRLTMRVGAEARVLEDADCRELFRAAVVIAVARARDPRAALSSEPRPERGPTHENGSSPRPPWHLRVAAGSGVSFGLAPEAVLAIRAEVQALYGRLGPGLRIHYIAEGESQDARERGVSVDGFGADLGLVYAPWPLLETRAAVAAYRLRGTGLGSLEKAEDTAFAVGPLLGAAFTPDLPGRLWVGVGADAQLNLSRPTFRILYYREVFRVPLFTGSAFVRLGWEFF